LVSGVGCLLRCSDTHTAVMAGLVPAIHADPRVLKDVDARDKPGHDDRVSGRSYLFVSTNHFDITVCTTLEIGLVLVVGILVSLAMSLAKASSYSGSVWKVVFALICTIL
jgi:hypothetical protein